MTIKLERRMLYIPVLHIDTNLINARQKLPAINQLEHWYANEVILINMSSTAHREAQADGNKARTRKANRQIFTDTAAPDPADPVFVKVEAMLFPNGAVDENQRNDVRIVCDAAKYAAILVTNDGGSKSQSGGILGNRHKLASLVKILSPEEAVSFVQDKIRERDTFNAQFVKDYCGELPSWTGED